VVPHKFHKHKYQSGDYEVYFKVYFVRLCVMRYKCLLGNVRAHFDPFYFLYVGDGCDGIMESTNLRTIFPLNVQVRMASYKRRSGEFKFK